MHSLTERVERYIREHNLLRAGHRVGVAVSGGADSVALLRLALCLKNDLGFVLSVVHFNHRLRGNESDEDQYFVSRIAEEHGLEFHVGAGDVRPFSREKRLSLEAAARELRYEFFREALADKKVDRIATAHTMDDQAETVLLRLARGAGTRGLSGIYPEVKLEHGAIVRPLLGTRRSELEAYLREGGQSWREDSSNTDLTHARNRVRQVVLPLMKKELNPNLTKILADTADLAREEEAYWNAEVAGHVSQVANSETSVNLGSLLSLPTALQRRLVRRVCDALALNTEIKHIREILAVAAGEAKATILSEEWEAVRSGNNLLFQRRNQAPIGNYEYGLAVPGRVAVPEIRTCFEAVVLGAEASVSNAAGQILGGSELSGVLTVRNWRPGDRYWPAHSGSPKKVKELLQERKISGPDRKLWPVVASGEKIVWVRGFPAPEDVGQKDPKQPRLVLRERPL